MNNRLDLNNWYQLDFIITTSRATLEAIAILVDGVSSKGLIDKWFYLFEGATIRVRLHSFNPDKLRSFIDDFVAKKTLTISPDHQFEGYWETTEAFSDIKVAETFADIMSRLTVLTTTRLKGSSFSNYKLVERLSHCIFNNTYGSDTEAYLLLKRLGIDFQTQDNPEQTVLDTNQKYSFVDIPQLKLSGVKVPLNK